MMAKNNNCSPIFLVNCVFHVVSKLTTDFANLAISDAALAKKSMSYVMLLFVFLFPLLTAFWFSMMGLFFILLRWLSFNWKISLLIVSVFNVATLVTVFFLLTVVKNNLFFNATRNRLKNLILFVFR